MAVAFHFRSEPFWPPLGSRRCLAGAHWRHSRHNPIGFLAVGSEAQAASVNYE